jgi:long-chain acyl-CoA synthetase
MQWGSEVVEGTVLGEPCRIFARRPRHLARLVEESARHGNRVHLVQGDQRMSFVELAGAVRAVGDRLRAEGAAPGDRILLFGANRLAWVVTFWACLANDWILIPGNAWWSAEEVAHAVRTTGAPRCPAWRWGRSSTAPRRTAARGAPKPARTTPRSCCSRPARRASPRAPR